MARLAKYFAHAATWTGLLLAEQAVAQVALPQAPPGPSTGAALPAGSASPRGAAAGQPASDLDEIYRRVFGKDRPAVQAGDYAVLIDGINVGEFRIRPADGREGGAVDSALIEKVLIPIVVPEMAARLRSLPQTRGEVTFAALTGVGIAVGFNPAQLVLTIDVPGNMRLPRHLNLQSLRARTDIRAVEQADISAYASLRMGVAVIEESRVRPSGFDRLAGDLDLAANFMGLVAEGEIRYDETRNRRWSRGDVRLTYDDRNALVRYELGDLSVGRRPFQVAPRIAGVSAFRNFNIDPYRNIRPTAEQLFELTRPARVEILLNGMPVRTFNLRSGRYSLRDFPLVSSATNDIEVRITYATGETETLLFPAFFDLELLAPGLVDFAVNMGVPYRDENGIRRYDTGTYTGSAYARLGLSSNFTAGLSWEGDRHFDLVGAELVWATGIGTFGINVGTNPRKANLKTSQLSLQYRWRDADRLRDRSIDASAILTGKDYRTLNQLFSGGFIAKQFALRMGQRISREGRVQLYGGYDQLRGPTPDLYYAGANYSHQLPFGSLSVGAEYRRDDRGSGPVVRAALTVPIGRGSLSSTYTSEDNYFRTEYARLADIGAGSLGYGVGAERRDGSDRAFGHLHYIGNRFEGTIHQIAQNFIEGRDRRDLRTEFTFGTALVMADGAVAVSRPVTNSFALFSVNPKAGEHRLAVEPRTGFGSTDTRYSAFSDALGSAVVPTLSPYFRRSIQVDAPDAPPGSSVGGQVFAFDPGYRSGYRIVVGSERNTAAVGTMVDKDGDPIAFATAEVLPLAEPEGRPIQIFTNASGRFYMEGGEAGKSYRIAVRIAGKTVMATLAIPEEAEGLYRLNGPLVLPVDVPAKGKE